MSSALTFLPMYTHNEISIPWIGINLGFCDSFRNSTIRWRLHCQLRQSNVCNLIKLQPIPHMHSRMKLNHDFRACGDGFTPLARITTSSSTSEDMNWVDDLTHKAMNLLLACSTPRKPVHKLRPQACPTIPLVSPQ
jgi:hypothetical protein